MACSCRWRKSTSGHLSQHRLSKDLSTLRPQPFPRRLYCAMVLLITRWHRRPRIPASLDSHRIPVGPIPATSRPPSLFRLNNCRKVIIGKLHPGHLMMLTARSPTRCGDRQQSGYRWPRLRLSRLIRRLLTGKVHLRRFKTVGVRLVHLVDMAPLEAAIPSTRARSRGRCSNIQLEW